jgi:hypothetical protein
MAVVSPQKPTTALATNIALGAARSIAADWRRTRHFATFKFAFRFRHRQTHAPLQY